MQLILLPGMDGTGTLYDRFVQELGPEVETTVVRYSPTEPMDYAGHIDVARESIPAEGPFVLLGESFGGPIAVTLAAEFASRVQGLILCGSFVKNPKPLLTWSRPLTRILPVGMVPISSLRYALMGRFATPELHAILKRAISQVAPAVTRARLHAILGVDVSRTFAALKLPILYLRATHDRVVARHCSELAAKLNSRTQIVDVAGPHWLLLSAPKDAADVVRRFLENVQTPGEIEGFSEISR